MVRSSRWWTLCLFLGTKKVCYFQITSYLSWLWSWRIWSWGYQVSCCFSWVILRISRLFSSMSYPVGSKHLLKCLKFMAELGLGKITPKEFMDLTTFKFSDFIISKNHVTPNKFRKDLFAIWVSLSSTPLISCTESILFITNVTKRENPKQPTWLWQSKMKKRE